jgi:hypothetical protein
MPITVAGTNKSGELVFTDRGKDVAQYYLDGWHQVDQIVILPGVSDKIALEALRMTARHAMYYVVYRDHSNGILVVKRRGESSLRISLEVLINGQESLPPEVARWGIAELTKALKQMGVTVTRGAYSDLPAVLKAATTDKRLGARVRFRIDRPFNYNELFYVNFMVAKPKRFRVWTALDRPRRGGDSLYIVPGYHPCMHGKRSDNLINGDTDALITGEAVRYVYAPKGSAEGPDFMSGTWSQAKHPFYCAGQQITMGISATKSLSVEGYELIVSLLQACLEEGNNYLSVSGGFQGPLDYPGNVAHRLGVRTSSYRGEARGSEGKCVWAYRTLENEGELGGAYVPSWFHSEGWLEAYARADNRSRR